ncbi:MAG: MAPEG family protein [Myxococcota bacterium]|jgi:uncharacterized MAPEG superfamily protein|nr:hypothetical protein [Spirochaeta sp.]MAJ60489.1 hypothetical protein [Deltaproteobacteria bacterium]RPG06394.1 MAG: MAPEG family protein [Proteobacteria bacterium TMED72]
MSVLIICLFIGAILPIALSWVGGYFRMQQFGKVDNKNPRAQSAGLEDTGARAVAAQQNAWEALALFTAGVVAFHARESVSDIAGILAMVWVAARVLHAIFYLIDLDVLRSLAFMVSLGCSLALFFI